MIKKFSSPKIKIWFPPESPSEARRTFQTCEFLSGAGGRNRTDDPFLFREVLYRLSYPSKLCPAKKL